MVPVIEDGTVSLDVLTKAPASIMESGKGAQLLAEVLKLSEKIMVSCKKGGGELPCSRNFGRDKLCIIIYCLDLFIHQSFLHNSPNKLSHSLRASFVIVNFVFQFLLL